MKRFFLNLIVVLFLFSIFSVQTLAEGEEDNVVTKLHFLGSRSISQEIEPDELGHISVTMDATAENIDGDNYPIQYSWESSSGDVIPEHNSPVFTIENFNLNDLGTYHCIVRDGYEELIYTATFTLNVNLRFEDGQTFIKDDIFITSDDLGNEYIMTATAVCDVPEYDIHYRWTKDGSAIGEDNDNLTISSLTTDDLGSYICTVTAVDQNGNDTAKIYKYIDLRSLSFEDDTRYVTLLANVGEDVTLDATASTSLDTKLIYAWEKDGTELDYNGPVLTINAMTKDDFGSYRCIVRSEIGGNEIIKYIDVFPDTEVSFKVTEYIVVPGEKLVIKGQAKALAFDEASIVEVWINYIDEYGDEWLNFVGDGDLLNARMYGESTLIEEDGYYISDFTLTIDEITERVEGVYGLLPMNAYQSEKKIQFSISVEDYSQLKLYADDGITIEGILHPAAYIEETPLNGDELEQFVNELSDEECLLWSGDLSLVIQGEADEYKGDLTVTIPVGNEYDGQELKVLHDKGESIEELTGTVSDGVLTFTTGSLSPFAVVSASEEQEIVDTNLVWKKMPEDVTAEIGDRIELNVKATSDNGEVEYEWYNSHEFNSEDWEGGVELVGTGDTFVIDSIAESDYGAYYCNATDGINTIQEFFIIAPDSNLKLDISEFIVVEGESIKIKGQGSVTIPESSDPSDFENEEEWHSSIISTMWAKYVPYVDEQGNTQEFGIDDWFIISETPGNGTDYSGVLDGHSNAYSKVSVSDGKLVVDFVIEVNDITDIWEGKYAVSIIDNKYGKMLSQLFSISLEDYRYTRLVGETGDSLQGLLHPNAQLFMIPIENEEDEEFLNDNLEDSEYIVLSREVFIKVQGEVREYKGELILSFNVGDEFEGQTLKVLHKKGDILEVLYGTVEDGMLSVTVDSLSPFAVVAEEEDDKKQDPSPDEKEDSPIDDQGQEKDGAVPEPSKEDEDSSIPRTGEESLLGMWVLLLLFAMVCTGLLLFKKIKIS